MKDLLGILRLCAYLFALPLIATAAASAHQWGADNAPVVAAEQVTGIDAVSTNVAVQPMLQDHVVRKNEAGEVIGQVAIYNPSQLRTGLRNLTIYFVQDGKIVEETRTDRDGGFKVGGLKDGTYSLIAAGDNVTYNLVWCDKGEENDISQCPNTDIDTYTFPIYDMHYVPKVVDYDGIIQQEPFYIN